MIKERKGVNSQKGSLTVEMALIFPFILVFVIFICFAVSMIYNRTVATALVNKNLDKANLYWLKSNVDFDTGAMTSAQTNIYSSLYDFKSEDKKKMIINTINDDIESFLLVKNISAPATIETHNYVIYRKLEVNVTIDYGYPFNGLFKMLGVGAVKDSFEVESVINNPVEFTRTIDCLIEIYDEIVYRFGLSDPIGKFKEQMGKLNDAIKEIDEFAK
jgi:hypothetical protein